MTLNRAHPRSILYGPIGDRPNDPSAIGQMFLSTSVAVDNPLFIWDGVTWREIAYSGGDSEGGGSYDLITEFDSHVNIDGDLYVGSRYSDPDAQLQILVDQDSDTPGTNPVISLIYSSQSGIAFRFSDDTTKFHLDRLYSGSWSDVLTIDRSTGYVGINKTSPTTELMVNGVVSSDTGFTAGDDHDVSATINGSTWNFMYTSEVTGSEAKAGYVAERYTDTADVAASFLGLRSKGSHASPSVVVDDDDVMVLMGLGYDGTDFEKVASIRFSVDGTPGNNDMPGKIQFYTTPDGSVTPTLAMTIDANNNVGIGTDSPSAIGHFYESSGDTTVRIESYTDNALLVLDAGTDGSAESAGVYYQQNSQSKWLVGMNFNNDFRLYDYSSSQNVMLVADGGSMTLSPGGDIILDPDGNDVLPGDSLEDDLGDYNRMWRTLYAAELYVETLVAQDVMATIGGRIMVSPTSKLIAGMNDTQTIIQVEHNSFSNGDFVMLKALHDTSAHFEIMKINSTASSITGGYQYDVLRDRDGSGANLWYKGDAVASFAGNAAGEGLIELTSTTTTVNHAGPNMTIYARTGTTNWNDVDAVVSIGNLESFADYSSEEFGFAIANDLTATVGTDFQGVTADRTNGVRLFDVDLTLYNSGNAAVILDHSDPYIAVGTTAPTSYLYSQGLWAGVDGSDFKAHIGDPSNEYISWDGSKLNVYGSVVVGPGVGFSLPSAVIHLPFDGPTPYATDFSFSEITHLGAANSSIHGTPIGRPGKFGKGAQFSRITTNLITNPSFESGAASWSEYGSVSAGQSTADAYIGSACVLVQTTGSNGDRISYQHTTSSGGWYSTQLHVKAEAPSDIGNTVRLRLLIYYTDASNDSITEETTLTSSWQRMTANLEADSGKTVSNVYVQIGDYSGNAYNFYVDAVQLENLSFCTSYVDGSMPDGSWTGTAHASTSTRSDYSYLIYPTEGMSTVHGAVMFWANVIDHADGTGNEHIFYNGLGGQALFIAAFSKDGTVRFRVGDDAKSTSSGAMTYNAWHHFAIVWDDGDAYLYIDGELVDSNTYTSADNEFGQQIRVGYSTKGVVIDDFVVTDYALTAQEIEAVYKSNSPIYVMSSAFQLMLTGETRGKVVGYADGLFGYDSSGDPAFAIATGAVTWDSQSLGASDIYLGSGAAVFWYDHSAETVLIGDPSNERVEIDGDTITIGDPDKNHMLLSSGDIAVYRVDTDTDAGHFLVDQRPADPTDPDSALGETLDVFLGEPFSSLSLTNPDFNSGSTGWTNWSQQSGDIWDFSSSYAACSVDYDTLDFAEGYLEQSSLQTATINDAVKVSFRIKGDSQAVADLYQFAYVKWKNSGGTTIREDRIAVDLTTSWVTHNLIFDHAPKNTASVVIGVRFDTNKGLTGYGTVYWDTFSADLLSTQGGISVGNEQVRLFGDVEISRPISLLEIADTPTLDWDGAGGHIYLKGNKLIVRFKDGSTVRYKYLNLTGTSTGWTHTTVAP